MSSSKITVVNNLELNQVDTTIKVKLLHMWKRTPLNKPNDCIIELIFADEEGTKIQAILFNNLFYKFEKTLKQNECYLINKPKIVKDCGNFKNVKHPFKIILRHDTSITKCRNFIGSLYGIALTSFIDIFVDETYLRQSCDIIGYVVNVVKKEQLTTKLGKQTKMKLTLQDLEKNNMPVTLWGTYADQFDLYVSNNPNVVHVVIILQFAKLNEYDGKYIENAYDATKMFINDENIEQIMDFKKRYIQKMFDREESSSQHSLGSIIVSDSEDEFVNKTLFTSIKNIKQCISKQVRSLDRTLKDVLSFDDPSNSQVLFGGKVVVFGGDFRQILPVVQNGSRHDIVNASLSSSYIWQSCKVLKLTKNMRLTTGNQTAELEEKKTFAKWLLDVGEGNFSDGNEGEQQIDIHEDLRITRSSDPLNELIEFVYPSILQNYSQPGYFQERAMLAPTNEDVQDVNDRLLSLFPGYEKQYLSSDSICTTEEVNQELHQQMYSPDVLNGLKISGLPNHKLALKVGVPVMLLRNIDPKNGLCNGTRLQIVSLGRRVIEGKVINGTNIDDRVLIPRLTLSPSDKKVPFKFNRRQFLVSVCFAMTINKSQGQSLSKVGLYLKKSIFTHGQLYVALSRVKNRDGLKLLILDEDGQIKDKTTNVVYKEVFGGI